MGNRSKKNRPKGPDPRDNDPLPTKEVDGEKHYDLERMNLHQRVKFLLWKSKDQEASILALRATVDQHRAGIMEANDLLHVAAALVRRAYPLLLADGTPAVDDFLRAVEREHESYASVFMPGLEPLTKATLENASVSHRLQKCTKAARTKAIEAIRAAKAAETAATAPTINPTKETTT